MLNRANAWCCRIFERAVAYCGQDYLGHTVWDKYLQFEEEQGLPLYIASLYSRILACPLKDLERYFKG